MKQVIFFLIFGFSTQAFALYDFAAMNITPEGDHVSFCLEYDTQIVDLSQSPFYFADNLYLAAVTQQADILFVKPTLDGGFTITPWLSGPDVPAFSQWEDNLGPICLGPFPKTALQNLQLYAGIGDSLEDVIQRNRIVKFFDGFPTLPKPEKMWTVMVYMVGSDLEAKTGRKGGKHWASRDILEMLEGTTLSSNQTSHLIVTTGGSTRNGWSTVKRSLIENGQQYVVEDLGAKNMADPQTLSDFVLWSKTHFPAQRYTLILWNHGGGTQGYGQDTSPAGNGDMMNLNQLHQAYQTIRQEFDKKLDLVVYDACLMGSIEVAEITATVANAMAGSAELEPTHGLDYAHMLQNINASTPDNGLAFANVVKNGYIEHTKDQGTFEDSQITYSVFDLTQLSSFTETFKLFAIEFKKWLEEVFSSYPTLSRGIIRAPGYPLIETGRLRSLTESSHIRVDLYNLLETVVPGVSEFSQYAADLRKSLEQMIDHEANDRVQNIQPGAGRLSLDINITNTDHLSVLPEAYTLISEGLVYYNERKQNDPLTLDSDLGCLQGLTCAEAQWLELSARELLSVEAYFGQSAGEDLNIYRIDKSFYQYSGELTEDLTLGVDGHKACQYQLCVSESHCEDITLVEQGDQLVADVQVDHAPAVLSFCQAADEGIWTSCRVVRQNEGVWGRDEAFYPGDSVTPQTWHLIKNEELEQRQGNALVVDETALVTLKTTCDPIKGAISSAFYRFNGVRKFERLCDEGDCICQTDDSDEGCQELGFKAGVILEY